MNLGVSVIALMLSLAWVEARSDSATEFCLAGEFDLGARLQGMRPKAGEYSASRWCIISDDQTDRVQFTISGKNNPDMTDSFTVSYLPPEEVRIVRSNAPPDVSFIGKSVVNEAARYRRIDPRRLLQELEAHPEWIVTAPSKETRIIRYPDSSSNTQITFNFGKLKSLSTLADMPLRGRVPVEWRWLWASDDSGSVSLYVDELVIFNAEFQWRTLDPEQAGRIWMLSGDQGPIEVPGTEWPAKISMKLDQLDDDIYMVRGVRTGFDHLVLQTDTGLIVGDAPAGWVELPQIPPADLVPGLGISGLSENLIDFLETEFPGVPIRAVAITHAHDDHAGGARAFAAAGAAIYAPSSDASFIEAALNRAEMPDDRFDLLGKRLEVQPVKNRIILPDPNHVIELIEMGPNPHVANMLGVLVNEPNYFFQSDVHVPRSDASEPSEKRAMTECWFAQWAVSNLPENTIVLSSHVENTTPVSRLAQYLESEICKSLCADEK